MMLSQPFPTRLSTPHPFLALLQRDPQDNLLTIPLPLCSWSGLLFTHHLEPGLVSEGALALDKGVPRVGEECDTVSSRAGRLAPPLPTPGKELREGRGSWGSWGFSAAQCEPDLGGS